MRMITFTDDDATALVDRLKMKKLEGPRSDLREDLRQGRIDAVMDSLHRAFHYEVVRWLQSQGATIRQR